jgi:dihydrofolate reductase
MRPVMLIAHTSLDGFVADINGSLNDFPNGEESLQLVNEIVEEADAALFGRISYRLLDDFWPRAAQLPKATAGEIYFSNWYNAADKIVISGTLPEPEDEKVMIIGRDVVHKISELKREPGKAMVIFGSPAVSQLLIQHDLIDIYWIFINSFIMGKGIPLFRQFDQKRSLEIIETKQLSNGELAIKYLRKSG